MTMATYKKADTQIIDQNEGLANLEALMIRQTVDVQFVSCLTHTPLYNIPVLLECGHLYLVGIPITKLNMWIFHSTIIALHYTVTLLYIDPSWSTALRLLKSVQLNHLAQALSLLHVGCVTTLVKYICIRTAHMMQTSYNKKKETHLLQLLSLENYLANSVYIWQWPGSQTAVVQLLTF